MDFLEQIGFGYEKLERDGIISPVIGLEGQYKSPTTFGDEVRIHTEIEEFGGVRLVVRYEMTNSKTGELVFTGKTKHCFTNSGGKPIPLKRQFPEFDAALKSLVKKTCNF